MAKRRYLIALCAIFLLGCAKPLTNDQIIAETKKCHDAGMNVVTQSDESGDVYKVICVERPAK